MMRKEAIERALVRIDEFFSRKRRILVLTVLTYAALC